jgi:23S rRNA pseudouridine2605 synthase
MRKPTSSSNRDKKSSSGDRKDSFKRKDSRTSGRSEKPKSSREDLNNEERPAHFYAKPAKPAFEKREKDERPARKSSGKFEKKSDSRFEKKSDSKFEKRSDSKFDKKSDTKTTSRFDKKSDPKSAKKDEPKKREKSKFMTEKDRQKKPKGDPLPSFSEDIRLNKYLSNAGISSRREADVLIETGLVKVNGKIITELGYKVKPGDEVKYDGGTVRAEKKRYVLLNKPKDFITTMDDPMERKTVMVLVAKACKERIYPVGRLDRNTTGLLLFTNDGDLAKKLTHPRYEMRKVYHVETIEPVTYEQINRLLAGVELDDGGFIKADKAEILKDKKNREVGIEIHSGKYRVVRRMFEALGHVVKKLDRVSFAGLTKKDLPRGNYRHLTDDEVNYLRML